MLKTAVLTRRGKVYGEHVVKALVKSGQRADLIVVENTPFSSRLSQARRLAHRIGVLDAARYNLKFWLPLIAAHIRSRGASGFSYENYAHSVVETSDISTVEVADALQAHKIGKVLLGHSGIVRRPILGSPNLWIINAHPGLLPEMRGVDVVRWSVIKGIPPGVTVHVVDSGVDTGPILYQERIAFRKGESLGMLEQRINRRCTDLLVEIGLAGPQAYTEPTAQRREDGTQHHLLPFRLHQKANEQLARRQTEAIESDS